MKTIKVLSMAAVVAALPITGCIDDKYDLSDIDTTVRVSVNDLTLPVNIDQILLKSIIDINESDPDNHIKIIDGAYAYVTDGDFSSGDITVPEVNIRTSKVSSVDLSLPVTLPSITLDVALPDISLTLPEKHTSYHFDANNISQHICALDHVGGNMDVTLGISITGAETLAKGYTLSQLQLQLPTVVDFESFSAPGVSYNAATGTLTIDTTFPTAAFTIQAHASGLTLPAGAFDESTHSLTLDGEVGVIGGILVVHPADRPTTDGLDHIGLKVDFAFSDVDVTTIDGAIRYDIDNINIPEITLNDLPDVLAQKGTNLVLANPALYLGVNNPLSVCGAYASTGFSITSYHQESSQVYTIDRSTFTISASPESDYCFAPSMPAQPDEAYAGSEFVPFTSLGRVLSGDGLPDKLKVDLIDPCLPRQQLTGFMLGHNYGNVHGSYRFVAPLQFDGGSQIVYSSVVDGWSGDSDDLDDLTITGLEVNLTVTTDVPVAVAFTGYPIDKQGRRINNVEIVGANIDANARDQQVKIKITGTVTGLDGIEFVATAIPAPSGAALSPDMHIQLSNIRPVASGYYQTEL